MKPLLFSLLLLALPAYSCDECFKLYIEQELQDSDALINNLLDKKMEECSPYFFFELGRNESLNDICSKLEKEKINLH